MSKSKRSKAENQNPDDTLTFSIRMTHGEHERIVQYAAIADTSTNQFFIRSALGCCDMIDHPTDNIVVPKVVLVGRILKHEMPVLKAKERSSG